jgi:hypothetical protein
VFVLPVVAFTTAAAVAHTPPAAGSARREIVRSS